jgi:hypothetical protein
MRITEVNKEIKMSEQEKEIQFERAVDKLDRTFMKSDMREEEYYLLYKQLKEKFGFR